MSNLRFAVFGAGWWSRYQIAAWTEVRGVDLVAICNRTRSKAESLAEEFNIPRVYSDPEELLGNEALDFVDLITGNDFHAPLVHLAAKHRVAVICQKPMATDWQTCLQMAQACREAGVPFMIHENLRWQAPVREVKRVMDAGAIGNPYRAHVSIIGYSPLEYVDQPFLKDLDKLTLMDIGSHVLDTSRFLFGEAQSVYCQHRRSRDDIRGEDVASVMMQMGDVICVAEMSNATRTPWNHYPDVSIFIEGTKGSIVLDWDYNLRLATDEGTTSRRIEAPYYDWLRGDQWQWHASIVPCNANCLREIRTGEPAETTSDDNIKSMQLVFAAYASAARNEVIQIKPVTE